MFVEFSENSVATEFVKNDLIRYKDSELIRLMKKDYFEKKAIERQETKKNIQIEKSQKLREQAQNNVPFISGTIETIFNLPLTAEWRFGFGEFGVRKIAEIWKFWANWVEFRVKNVFFWLYHSVPILLS